MSKSFNYTELTVSPLFIYNVKGQDLLSKEWCDLVFEGRNKEYGAYVLRRDTGRRYKRVAMLLAALLLGFLVFAGVSGYFVYQAVTQKIAEVEEELQKMTPLQKEEEVKKVSAGRRAIKNASPKAKKAAPDVVEEEVDNSGPIGVIGPEDIEIVDAEEMEDKDLKHNTDQQDLPVEGVQLQETEVVEEMPTFPGGLDALMKFMDENVIYSSAAISRKLEGDVQVAFIIAPDGSLIEPEIIKKVHPLLDDAVLNAVKRMPKWKPGRVNGRPASVKVCIPVHFQVR